MAVAGLQAESGTGAPGGDGMNLHFMPVKDLVAPSQEAAA